MGPIILPWDNGCDFFNIIMQQMKTYWLASSNRIRWQNQLHRLDHDPLQDEIVPDYDRPSRKLNLGKTLFHW